MPSLRIVISGQAFDAALPAAAVRVGSASTVDLSLACPGVAAEHLLLEPTPSGAWRLKDLGSPGGTRVNGQPVRQVSLKAGDVITVGEASITFDPPAAPAAVPAARPAARAAMPAAPAVPAARPAPAVPARPAVPAPAASAAAPGPASAATPPAAQAPRAVAPRPSAPARRSSGKLVAAVLLVAAIGVVLVFAGLSGGGGGDADAAQRAQRDLEQAVALYKARDVLAAREALAALTARVRTGEVARQASTWLDSANAALTQAQGELEGWVSGALDFDLAAAASREAVFLERHGACFAPKAQEALARIAREQQAWRDAEVARVRAEAGPLLDEGRYREARARWAKARASAPSGVDMSEAVAQALAEVDAQALASAEALLERAATAARVRGAAAAAEILSPAVAAFEGTAAHERMAARLADLAREARVVAAQAPAAPSSGPAAPQPTATAPAATQPAPSATAQAPAPPDATWPRLEADLVKAHSERAFARAVDLLDQMLALAPAEDKARLQDLRADVALARTGLDALAGAVTADPKRFGRFDLSDRLSAAPVSADREGLSLGVQGGSTRLRWASMKRDILETLCERMAPQGPDAISVAALLNEVGAREACERMLVQASRGGNDTATIFTLLARWRGEEVPAGGYVLYEGRYLTPQQRDELILAGRIRSGIARLADARDEAARRAVIEEVLALGDSARQPLAAALVGRRATLIEAIGTDKSLVSGRVRQRLYEMLEERRAHALALIEDERAYPYPNPSKMGQAEVEKRVAAVRDIWERPLRVVAGLEPAVQQQLDLIAEIDSVLVRVIDGYKPDLKHLEDTINRAIDMPAFAPGSAAGAREYALKVLAYNERVDTTAGREEKDNVRAVNEYRIMMGRAPVKIEERLVRAARGHSRHMNQNGYFAHEAPAQFADLLTPGHRARRQGYGGGVGENIAWGMPTGRDAFWGWFGSSGHHRNMLGRGWTEMGAGRSVPSHWTQLFGAASGKSLGTPDALPAPAADVAPDPEGPAQGSQGGNPLVPRVPDVKPPGSEGDAGGEGG